MDLKQLRALLAVSEHHSFSTAARALHTVQSNVSTHIARLEREVGAVLIDRTTNALTAEGQVIAERARRIETEFAALDSDVAALRDEIRGQIKVGVIGTTARWLVPLLLEAMTDRLPLVRCVILDATTTSLIPQLVTGRIDLAVVNAPIDDVDVSIEALFGEDLVLVAPAGHALAQLERVRLSDLADHPLLLEASGTTFRIELDEQASALGVELTAQAEVDGMRLLASLAFSGFGAAVLPASAAPGGDPTGKWRRILIDDVDGREVVLARRRRGLPSPAEREVRALISDVVAEAAPTQSGIHPRTAAHHDGDSHERMGSASPEP